MTDPPSDNFLPDDPPRLEPEQVGAWLRGRIAAGDRALGNELELSRRSAEGARRSLELVRRELPSHLDPHDLAQAGWGVIFPPRLHARLWEPLRPLLELRESRAGERFHVFRTQRGESAALFLARHRERPGVIRPERMPYYLLIVGDPEQLSFEFQYHLSLNHAVGRIAFERSEDYRHYAEAVREAESGGVPRPRRTVLFAPEHDETTRLLGEHLVLSLQLFLETDFGDEWTIDVFRHRQATRARLRDLLGSESPGLLLVSAHGLRVRPGAEHQEERQGAILCQPEAEGEKPRFAAADLAVAADVRGLIGVFLACYGAGTPDFDDFPHEGHPRASEPRVLGRRPFVARLPQELLRRGALAVVGHVDRGWTLSFFWGDVETSASLEDSLRRLLRGHRLGHALRPLHRRYAQLTARLAQMLDAQRGGVELDEATLHTLGTWRTAAVDARNFVVVGDPAVYLLGRRPSEAVFRLEPDLLRLATRHARACGLSVEAWIDRILREHLR